MCGNVHSEYIFGDGAQRYNCGVSGGVFCQLIRSSGEAKWQNRQSVISLFTVV